MGNGIAPEVLFNDVRATAAWALEPGFTQASYQAALLALDRPDTDWRSAEHRPVRFRSLLAAHFATCATFCPTDVDNRIRFHVWQEAEDVSALEALVREAEEAVGWPVPEVSARLVRVDHVAPPEALSRGILSGHAGEWLSVFAGALGRAHALGANGTHVLRARIEAELRFEWEAWRGLAREPGREIDAICALASIAHNIGDLARVADAWAGAGPGAAADRGRYTAVPTAPLEPFGDFFVVLGEAYKDLLADSNHRYLPLRAAKCLRQRRDFLLPTGPFLDAWGEHVSRENGERERAEILSALLAGHAAAPSERGYLRAISGMNRGMKGGVDGLERDLPARLRKVLRAGAVRPALELDARRFEERMRARYLAQWHKRLTRGA